MFLAGEIELLQVRTFIYQQNCAVLPCEIFQQLKSSKPWPGLGAVLAEYGSETPLKIQNIGGTMIRKNTLWEPN
jgi:hypothetical protein